MVHFGKGQSCIGPGLTGIFLQAVIITYPSVKNKKQRGTRGEYIRLSR